MFRKEAIFLTAGTNRRFEKTQRSNKLTTTTSICLDSFISVEFSQNQKRLRKANNAPPFYVLGPLGRFSVRPLGLSKRTQNPDAQNMF